MGKRSATHAAAAQESKRARHSVDPFLEELQPVLQLATSLPDSCREMLAAMAPHIFNTVKEDRHRYQDAVVDVLCRVLNGVQAERQHGAESAQRGLEEAMTETAPAQETVARASQVEAAAKAEMDRKADEVAEAANATAAAKEALAKGLEALHDAESAHAAAVAVKEEYEQHHKATWEELKISSIPGRQWRVRDHKICGIIEVLTAGGAEASVISSLPVALKVKAGERGSFAQKVVDYVEGLLGRHYDKLVSGIGAAEEEVAARKKAVEDAETALKGAEQREEELTQKHVQLQNAWVELVTAEQLAVKRSKELDAKVKRAGIIFKAAQHDLAQVEVVATKFYELCERSNKAAQSVTEQTEEAESAPPAEPATQPAEVEEAATPMQ